MQNGTWSIDYKIFSSSSAQVVCFPKEFLENNGYQKEWEVGEALASALPFFISQLFVSNFTYHVLYYLTRPLYLPSLVAQILCGVLFSPPLLGGVKFFVSNVFPLRFTMVLETFGNLALAYNVFLLGVEMDLRIIKKVEKKALSIAATGVMIPFAIGIGLFYLPGNGIPVNMKAGSLFWAIILSSTNFPELARILADLKLLRTEMGRVAMSAAIFTDLCTWILLILVFAGFDKEGGFNKMMPYVLISTMTFALFCIYVIRPTISWVFSKTTKRGNMSDAHVWFTLGGVVLCGLVTDMCGVHSITGAFMLGLVIPHDHLIRNMIEEKLHDFLSGILMPLFFIVCGLRSDLSNMLVETKPLVVPIVIAMSFMAKIFSTFAISLLHRMHGRDVLALGLLMNTKGVLALTVLNSARDTKALTRSTFTLMLLVLFVMSMIVEPCLAWFYRPKKTLVHHKYRTIQRIKQEAEFRILACIHDLPNASGIINLLHISHPTKQSPLSMFGIHLVELTGRTTASMLIMHDECKPKLNFSDRIRAESDQIAEAFETIEVNSQAVTVQMVTAVSPYVTMHEDICALALDKQVCFIIMPYHKQITTDGRMGEGNASHADIIHNVLDNSPCSVGILVDHGMGITRAESIHGDQGKKLVAMLFEGGADAREALTYAWRMAGDHNVNLTVIRFIPSREALMSSMSSNSASSYEMEKKVDDECIYEFNFKTMNDSSVSYIEKVVNNGQETIAMIREMEDNRSFDLYVVGRGDGVDSPVTAGLSDWGSSPELGTIGDTLASSNFTMHASVLVVQQYPAGSRHAVAKAEHSESSNGQLKTSYDIDPFMKPTTKGSNEDEEDEYDYIFCK